MTSTTTATVLRAVPRLGPGWDAVEHAISIPLVRLTSDPADPRPDGPLPPGTTAAWWRISAAVRAEQARPVTRGGPCPGLCLVTLRPHDVDTLGACARTLGRTLLPAPAPVGSVGPDLVLDLARLHGVLDLDPGPDGDLLNVLAGIRTTATDAQAAYRRLSTRVTTMWTAGS